MRICLFTPTFLPSVGGAERMADAIVRGLIDRGHRVSVLGPAAAGPTPPLPYPVLQFRRPPALNLWPEMLCLAVRRAYRLHPFDVMLAFYGYPTGYAGSLLKRRLSYGLVVSARGGDHQPIADN